MHRKIAERCNRAIPIQYCFISALLVDFYEVVFILSKGGSSMSWKECFPDHIHEYPGRR